MKSIKQCLIDIDLLYRLKDNTELVNDRWSKCDRILWLTTRTDNLLIGNWHGYNLQKPCADFNMV